MKKYTFFFFMFLVLSLCCNFVVFADVPVLQEKVAGNPINATEWNGIKAAIIDGVSDTFTRHAAATQATIADVTLTNHIYQADFIIAATDMAAPSWESIVVPIMVAPKDMAITVVQISAGTVGGGTLTCGFSERSRVLLDAAGSTIIVPASGILCATMTDFTSTNALDYDVSIAAGNIVCITSDTGATSSTIKYVVGSIYYKRDAVQ